MGQYHYPTNWDRCEYINPHKFGDGLKLLEFGCSAPRTLLGLTVLLASSNKGGARGGGDLHPWHGGSGYEGRENDYIIDEDYEQRLMDHVVGRWAGDTISVLGDYHEEDEIFGKPKDGSPWYETAADRWTDISGAVVQAICLDYYVRSKLFAPHKDGEHMSFNHYLPQDELVLPDGTIIPSNPKETP
jgi:hypothetical protein